MAKKRENKLSEIWVNMAEKLLRKIPRKFPQKSGY